MRRFVCLLLLALPVCGCQVLLGDGGGNEGGGSEAPPPAEEPAGEETQEGDPTVETPPASGEHLLEPRWRPLEKIVERPPLPGVSNTVATTVGTEIYVQDLDAWLAERPPGSPRYEALLRHEQVHARRQQAAGVQAWLRRYVADRAFMWAEEQLGYYEQLTALQQAGQPVSPEGTARTISDYRNLQGSMVSYGEALEWVNQVLNGRWRPDTK